MQSSIRSLFKTSGCINGTLGRRSSNKSKIEKFCKNVPTILFDSNLEGLGAAFVGSDNQSFISQTVEYLNSTGSAPSFLRCATQPTQMQTKEEKLTLKLWIV